MQQNSHSLSLKETGMTTTEMLQTSVSENAKLQQTTYRLRIPMEDKDRCSWRRMI